MTDWGAHHNDIALWAVGLPGPESIEGKALAQPVPGGYTAFSEYEVKFTYANGVVHRVRTTKADNIYGGVETRWAREMAFASMARPAGCGSSGNLKASDPALLTTPLPDGAPRRLYASADHMGNFFDCVRSRKLPIADVEVGHRSVSACHLGVIALRTGLPLQWDAAKEQFTGEHAREATQFITREMRAPYNYSFV